MARFDKYWIGILIGLILPTVFGLTYINRMNLWYALQAFGSGSNFLLSKILLVSAFPDMALLFIFYETDTWRLAKGVLIGCIPYLMASAAFSA